MVPTWRWTKKCIFKSSLGFQFGMITTEANPIFAASLFWKDKPVCFTIPCVTKTNLNIMTEKRVTARLFSAVSLKQPTKYSSCLHSMRYKFLANHIYPWQLFWIKINVIVFLNYKMVLTSFEHSILLILKKSGHVKQKGRWCTVC